MLFEEYKKTIENIDIGDYASLLNIGRKWKKIENVSENDVRELKIAFLGSASLQLVTSVTRALLSKYDVYANVYEGEYNGILMDAMDEKSKLYDFAPEYVVILPDYRDIEGRKPRVLADTNDIFDEVDRTKNIYIKIFDAIHSKLPSCQILFSNFVTPFWDSLGNLEVNYLFSLKSFVEMVNLKIIEKKPSYVNIIDMDGLACFIGKANFFDESSYFLSKSGFALPYIGYVSDLIARQFEGFIGRPKKCLALDLDNTLWGGVVGDLGYDGINLDPNDGEGEAFLAFQKYILELKQRGIILAICSKNDLENAKEAFENNPNMVLKLSDFACFTANWNDKATNLRQIAQNLNIGIDSIVFFDDNPTERALIKEYVPEVKVIDVPNDPALYIRALDQAHAFEWNQLTKEDISRVQSYADNAERDNLLESCVNYDEYLKKLHMKIKISEVDETSASRFCQLTNKSNQFNLRTMRYSEAEVSNMMADSNYELLAVSMRDIFSNYGIIACVLLKFEGDDCIIENWVMSCRVIKKTVEMYTAEKIIKEAVKHGSKYVKGEYIPSKKNGMVSDLYDNLGFTKINTDEEKLQYILEIKEPYEYNFMYHFEEDLQ